MPEVLAKKISKAQRCPIRSVTLIAQAASNVAIKIVCMCRPRLFIAQHNRAILKQESSALFSRAFSFRLLSIPES